MRLRMSERELKMPATTRMYPWLGLVVLLVVCFAAAGIGGSVTTPKNDNWYATLVKPSWNPPNWIFSPVWSLLNLCMAIAVCLPGGKVVCRVPLGR